MFFIMDCDYSEVRLTFHSPIVLQKQIVCQSARKALAAYRNHIFIRPRLSSLSWTTYPYVYCTPSYETTFNSIFTLSSKICVGLRSGFYLSCLPTKNSVYIFLSAIYLYHMTNMSKLRWFDEINYTVFIVQPSVIEFSLPYCYLMMIILIVIIATTKSAAAEIARDMAANSRFFALISHCFCVLY